MWDAYQGQLLIVITPDVNDITSNVLSFVNSITADTGGIGTEIASEALSFASSVTCKSCLLASV